MLIDYFRPFAVAVQGNTAFVMRSFGAGSVDTGGAMLRYFSRRRRANAALLVAGNR